MPPTAKSGAENSHQEITTLYDTRSRPLTLGKRVQIPIIVNTALALEHVICPTVRFEVLGRQNYENVLAAGRRCIYSFWHQAIFLATWWWRGQGVVPMTSANFDGQLIAGLLERMGYGTAQGSSTRGGLRGLATLAERMGEGRDAAFAVDGPRGPRHVAKPGPVLLARRTGFPIVCLHMCAERRYTFRKSWDRFQLPYPFSRAVLIVAPPIEVAPDADREAVEAKVGEMQRTLEEARGTAESWFTLAPAEQDRQRARLNV